MIANPIKQIIQNAACTFYGGMKKHIMLQNKTELRKIHEKVYPDYCFSQRKVFAGRTANLNNTRFPCA